MENQPFCNFTRVLPKNVFAELSETYQLSPEQKKFYEENGYLVINQLFDFSSLYNFRKRFNQICNGVVEKGFISIVKEPSLYRPGAKPEEYVNKIQDIHFDDVFTMYTENPRLLDVVSQFLGDKLTCIHSMLINKPPGTSCHPPHQDQAYFPIRPADKIMCAYTAIDDVERENGCLYVIPASHKRNILYKHTAALKDKKLYNGVNQELVPEHDRVYVELSPGDTMLFHPMLLHGSGENKAKKYRKTILCHYMASDCEYIDVTGTNQEEIAKGIEAESNRRGIPLNFSDVWRFKSKEIIMNSKL